MSELDRVMAENPQLGQGIAQVAPNPERAPFIPNDYERPYVLQGREKSNALEAGWPTAQVSASAPPVALKAGLTTDTEPQPAPKSDEPQGIPGSWANALIGLGMGLQGKVGDFYQMQQQQLQRQQEMQAKREQAKEQQFNQFFDQMSKIDKEYGDDQDKWEMATRAAAARGNPLAKSSLALGAGSKYRGQFNSLMPILQEVNGELVKQYRDDPKSIPLPKLKANLDFAAKIQKERMDLEAEQAFIRGIQSTPREKLDTVALKHLDEYEKHALEMEEKRSKVENIPVEQASKVDAMNKQKLEMQKLEAELAGQGRLPQNPDPDNTISAAAFDGRPWNQLTNNPASPQSIAKLERMGYKIPAGASEFEALNEAARQRTEKNIGLSAAARRDVQMDTMVPQRERANLFNREEFMKGRLVKPKPGMKEGQIRAGDWIDLSDKQQDAVAALEKIKVPLTEVMGLADKLATELEPLSAKAKGVANWIGAVTGLNPDAATYQDMRSALSSTFARAFGTEVGVMTEGDIQRWVNALPKLGDTSTIKNQKKAIFAEIFNTAVRAQRMTLAGEDASKEQEKIGKLLDRADKAALPISGTIQDGYRFKGGDPGKRENWEKVK